jgi:hypothetical protein
MCQGIDYELCKKITKKLVMKGTDKRNYSQTNTKHLRLGFKRFAKIFHREQKFYALENSDDSDDDRTFRSSSITFLKRFTKLTFRNGDQECLIDGEFL